MNDICQNNGIFLTNVYYLYVRLFVNNKNESINSTIYLTKSYLRHPICYKYYNKFQQLHRKFNCTKPWTIYICIQMTDIDQIYKNIWQCLESYAINYVLIKNNSVVVHFNFHYRSSLQLKFIRLYDLITLEPLVILKHNPSYSLL